jgi:hypothetical protein
MWLSVNTTTNLSVNSTYRSRIDLMSTSDIITIQVSTPPAQSINDNHESNNAQQSHACTRTNPIVNNTRYCNKEFPTCSAKDASQSQDKTHESWWTANKTCPLMTLSTPQQHEFKMSSSFTLLTMAHSWEWQWSIARLGWAKRKTTQKMHFHLLNPSWPTLFHAKRSHNSYARRFGPSNSAFFTGVKVFCYTGKSKGALAQVKTRHTSLPW